MHNAYKQFNDSIKYVKDLDTLFEYLTDIQKLPNDLTDLLRAEWVYSVSALDKLIHELVRVGMLQSFLGLRPKTRKFNAFTISVDTMANIQVATIPPAEYWFEQEIIQKHKALSFQDPDKISDILSLIWDENNKWQKISLPLLIRENDVKVTLKTIVNRRNQIVHEADLDLISGIRQTIDRPDTFKTVDLVTKIGESIYNCVK